MSRQDKTKTLEKIYYDVEEGFGSARDLYEKSNKVDAGITPFFCFKVVESTAK